MTAAKYRIDGAFIDIIPEGGNEPLRRLARLSFVGDDTELATLLHRANTQPGLLAALGDAAHALEITADFVAGIHNAPGVDPYVPPDSATVKGIRDDAQLARAAVAAATPVKGE